MKTRKGEPVIVVPEEQQQIVELERQLAERDRRIGELEVELRRWRGCPSCKEDHDDSVMCPPHEVRTSGRAWFHTQARKWAERAEELQAERDELKRKLDACQCETRVLNESMLIEAEKQCDQANERVKELTTTNHDLFATVRKQDTQIETLEQERNQLAAECGLLREALMWASARLESIRSAIEDWRGGPNYDAIQDTMRLMPETLARVNEAFAATPHAAKAAERVKATAEVVQLGSLRPEVVKFASVMEYVLQNNDDKGGWKDCGPEWLLGRLEDEVRELREVLRINLNRAFRNETEIRYEAADVANFAMMIADVCGALASTPHAAKAAERVKVTGDMVKAAREADTLLTNYLVNGRLVRGGDGEEVRDMLREVLDRLDALDKTEVHE